MPDSPSWYVMQEGEQPLIYTWYVLADVPMNRQIIHAMKKATLE
jgi:hypothetical protein